MTTSPLVSPPLPMALRMNLGKKLLYGLSGFLLSACGVGAMVAAVGHRASRGSGTDLGVLAIGAILLLAALWVGLGAPRMQLHLTEEGFTLVNPWHFRRARSVRWSDVAGDFCVVTVTRNGIPVSRLIGWNFAPGVRKPTLWRKLDGMGGWEASIPAGFGGMSAGDLADLMSRLRAQRAPRLAA